MAVNKFEELRKQVQDELRRYEAVCEQYKGCHSDPKRANMAHYETIHQLAKPFIDGKFTLAIVGKMSSGKSTFINALIGEQILPTGHFQTTSAITYIERGEKLKMKVTFNDESCKEFEGRENIHKALKELVAVKEEFATLPINHIDTQICGGKSTTEILSGKGGLEFTAKCGEIDERTLRKYCDTHNKGNIAKEVRIWTPMDESFEGWQIIDTPGVSAVGGIQDCTIKILTDEGKYSNNAVDAIIFLQSGVDNIEDKANVDFVDEVFAKLTPSVRERIFFVLTHSATQDFRLHKEGIIERAKRIYSKIIADKQDRFCCVDSLLWRFLIDAYQNKVDFECFDELDSLPNWDDKALEVVTSLYTPAKKELKKEGKEVNSENIIDKLIEWANFDSLLERMNKFVEDEKGKTVRNIYDLMCESFSVYGVKLNERLGVLKGQISFDEKRNELQKKRSEYQTPLAKLQRLGRDSEITKEFDFVDVRLNQLSDTNISNCRQGYLSLIDDVHSAEKRLFDKLKQEFLSFCNNTDLKNDVYLASIDFSAIEAKAQKASQYTTTREETDYSRPVTRVVERKWSGPDRTSTTYPYKKTVTEAKTDMAKKAREFKAYILTEARSAKSTFMDNIKKKVQNFCEGVNKDITDKLDNAQKELAVVERNIKNRDAEISKIECVVSKIKEADSVVSRMRQ